MHLLDQRLLGGLIVILLAVLVTVKYRATGSVLDRPGGGALVQAVNVFNLFFLLVVNPVAAVLLIARNAWADPTHVAVGPPWLLTTLEVLGLAVYMLGFLLMAWALLALGRNYQLGGSVPRESDILVAAGPYRRIRHPMYAAAIAIAFGLATLLQSLAVACVFCGYVVLILLLIPLEEDGLRRTYGARWEEYGGATKRLVPFLY